jgi:ferredoxin
MGYGVTVFESNVRVGGMLREEVERGELPEEILDAQIKAIEGLGVKFETNVFFGRELTLETLEARLYKTVLLATGPGSILPEGMVSEEEGVSRGDPGTLEYGKGGLFAGGGLIMGNVPLVKVMASATQAAISMDLFMRGPAPRAGRDAKVLTVKRLPKKGIKTQPRQEVTGELSDAFSSRIAEAEAKRCMTCGSLAHIAYPEDCMTCFQCELNCPSGAVYIHPYKEWLPRAIRYPGDNHSHA